MNSSTPQAIHKRSSCYFNTQPTFTSSPPSTPYSVFNPSTWFPRMRQRSTSSSSSTFSTVYSPTTPEHVSPHLFLPSPFNIENLSEELQEHFDNVKTEIDFATESQGSIYYEGDLATAHSAFSACLINYESALQTLGDTTDSVKFAFRWESDIHQLRLRLHSLPEVTHSIYN
ncbi:hypothetical protein BY458DRAFT_520892 [Sporodiniella umbellata]|nr:hypothetical protein BY458DRAFT_520892 [Sporodiniella umbellata]